MTEPRNVTPGTTTPTADPEPAPAGSGSGGGSRPPWDDFHWGGRGQNGPEWSGFRWARFGRGFPWGGVLLVLVGGALLLQEAVPGLSFSTIFLLGIGIVFLAAWLLGRSRFAATPAFVLIGLGAAPLLRDLGYVRGNGWTALCLGAALLALWAIGEVTHQRHGWALWVGGILGLIGLAQVSDQIPGVPNIGSLWPVLLILLGIVVIFGGRFGRGRPV